MTQTRVETTRPRFDLGVSFSELGRYDGEYDDQDRERDLALIPHVALDLSKVSSPTWKGTLDSEISD